MPGYKVVTVLPTGDQFTRVGISFEEEANLIAEKRLLPEMAIRGMTQLCTEAVPLKVSVAQLFTKPYNQPDHEEQVGVEADPQKLQELHQQAVARCTLQNREVF